MESRSPDLGFALACSKLIFKIIADEVRSTTPNYYDIKLSLKYISWIREMRLCRLDNELSMYFDCLDTMTSRLCTTPPYYLRLSWQKMRTYFATAILRLLTKCVSRRSPPDSEIGEMCHLLDYIKLYDPQLFEPNASGKLNPFYENLLQAYCDYAVKYFEHERRVAYYESLASRSEDTEVEDRFSEIFNHIFGNKDSDESEDGSPF